MDRKSADHFLAHRAEFAEQIGHAALYDYIDHFALYAGVHTIGNKLFTYEMFGLSSQAPGHIVEFGSWKGSNLMFLAKLKTLLEPNSFKKIIGFDNFAGLPSPDDRDGDFAKTQEGLYCGDEDVLRRAIDLFGFKDMVELVVGDACRTIPEYLAGHQDLVVSFAYLDFDLYEPTKAALELVEAALAVGGLVVFDEACTQDWPGETIAMKEHLCSSRHTYEMINNRMSRQPTLALKRVA